MTETTRRMGYVVIAIPESGLFFRDGSLATGDGEGSQMAARELLLFSRESDARHHAQAQDNYWNKNDHRWTFPVVPVLVIERS